MSDQVIRISVKQITQIAGLFLAASLLFIGIAKSGQLIWERIDNGLSSPSSPHNSSRSPSFDNPALLQIAYRELLELHPPESLSKSLYTEEFIQWYEANRDGNLLRGRASTNPDFLNAPILIWEGESFVDLILLVDMSGGYKVASLRLVKHEADWQVDKLWYIHGRELSPAKENIRDRDIPLGTEQLLAKASIELLELHSPDDLTRSAYTPSFLESYEDIWNIWNGNPLFGTLNPNLLEHVIVWQQPAMLDVLVKSTTTAGYTVMELRLVQIDGSWKVDKLLLGPTNRKKGEL